MLLGEPQTGWEGWRGVWGPGWVSNGHQVKLMMLMMSMVQNSWMLLIEFSGSQPQLTPPKAGMVR